MTTITIDFPDANAADVFAALKKLGAEVRQSKLSSLDNLTKEDYEKHFAKQATGNRDKMLKYL